MGNSGAKLNRKFDNWIKKAYNYLFKEEIDQESQSDVASENEEILEDIKIDQNQYDIDQASNQKNICDNIDVKDDESLISTQFIKDEQSQDKRKASYQLIWDCDSKKVCVDKEIINIVE